MSAPGIVVILWVLFYAYWMIAAVGVKKNIRRTGRTGWAIRLFVIAAIFLVFRIPGLSKRSSTFKMLTRDRLASSLDLFSVCAGSLSQYGHACTWEEIGANP